MAFLANSDRDARVPVIVGTGEYVDRPDREGFGLEPADLMANALRLADRDAGGGWLGQIDSLDVINSVSWPYRDPLGVLTSRLQLHPRRQNYGPIGGETPVRFVHEAACRIAAGECEVAAVCGGEAEYTVRRKQGQHDTLPWADRADNWNQPRDRSYLHPLARQHGLNQPIFVYPLYETACQAAWGQTPVQGQSESAALWQELSRIASENPSAFVRGAHTAREIATMSPSNRPIAWPYSKLMVANPVVNQGGAILVTSLARAREAGIALEKLVFIGAGAAANEPRDWLSRENYRVSPAQDAVLDAVLDRTALTTDEIAFFELYSCFPCVPKMARRSLGLADHHAISVTGGLTFFGAPLNAYMIHGIAAMVRRLRGGNRQHGLVYGQGEFVTKHHGLMLSSYDTGYAHGDIADAQVGDRIGVQVVPPIIANTTGPVQIETFTVIFDRDGEPTHGSVVARTAEQHRTLARVPGHDKQGLALLMRTDRSSVGITGILRQGAQGLLECAIP